MNRWPQIRLMGSQIAQDTLTGVTVPLSALPLASFGVASGLGAITKPGVTLSVDLSMGHLPD